MTARPAVLLAPVVLLVLCGLVLLAGAAGAAPRQGALLKAPVNLHDTASLQRGARLYVNYCMGCHSLRYLRYGRMARDLKIPKDLARKYLDFAGEKIGGPMKSGMTKAQGKAWFGTPPPDLTLEARVRSPDWIYSYLLGFYKDDSRPYGYNNTVYPKVGMPDVLAPMEQRLGEKRFHRAVGDLTNFLTYAAEPVALTRRHLGVYVLVFLAILMVPVYLLKKEYWKDVH